MTSTWGRTPQFGAQTPMVGNMTPSYGSLGGMTPLPGGGMRTPIHGSQTPLHGDGRTVVPAVCIWNSILLSYVLYVMIVIGSRTPSYGGLGGMTPSHDSSRTPLHGTSAWDPSVTNTPARTDDWYYDNTAPSPGVSHSWLITCSFHYLHIHLNGFCTLFATGTCTLCLLIQLYCHYHSCSHHFLYLSSFLALPDKHNLNPTRTCACSR